MLVTNKTTSDIYFGPLHLAAGVGETLTVDDTSETSLYLTNDGVADALNNAYQAGQIDVSGAAEPFPRPVGDPQIYHGSGDPEGLVYAPQGSVYMRRDGTETNGGVLYMKTTGITESTGWLDLATASGTTAVLPPGLVMAFGGASAPTGWLICDGSAISRTTYSLLFAAIGTTYGAGDGSTTFNLPDLQGRVAISASGSDPLGTQGGEQTHTLTTSEMPVHNHGVNDPGHHHSGGTASGSGGGNAGCYSSGTNTSTNGTGISIQNAGSGGAHNNMQPYLVLTYIIKT